MSLPKEPRQKMINVMYLVLTALLALNVSAEILNAFKTVDRSLLNSNGVIDAKNATIFKSFTDKLAKAETKDKAQIWYPKAQKAKQLADDVTAYLDGLKKELKVASGLQVVDGVEQFKEDNLDAATKLFVEPGKKKGEEILEKLKYFKEQILAIDPEITKEFASTLPLDLEIPKSSNKSEVGKKEWAYSYFHMTPTIAAITIFSKFQNDVKNSESQIVEYCHKKIGQVDVVFDSYAAFAGTNSQYLMPGQELIVTAGVGAFSKSAQPKITVDGASVAINPTTSAAEYKTTVGGPGSYSKKVRIDFFNQATGKPDSKDVEIKYTVGSPTGVSISADAVRVLYIGVPQGNPLTISGGAKGAETVQATIDNGTIKNNGGGKWVADVEKQGTATINVSVDGKTTPFTFKVKKIPPPTPQVGTSKGGTVSVGTFKASQGVSAILYDFVFEGITYKVSKFNYVFTGKGFETTGPVFGVNNGAYFTPEANAGKDRLRVGSTVSIYDIFVEGPDGTRKLEGAMSFNLSN